jgi:hypothetical protein
MNQLFFGGDGLPLSKPEDVIPFLGKGPLHWKKGRSAFETAHSWFGARNLPSPVRAILNTNRLFADAVLTRAYFERSTPLDRTGRGPSQTDVLALLKTKSGVAVLGVEAKVDETFGPYVGEWADGSPGRAMRLALLIEELKLEPSRVSSLRYQLLHRTVATILESRQVGAHDAIMLVQSFSPREIRAGFTDFQFFADAMKAPIAAPGLLSEPVSLDDVRLWLGWTENVPSPPEIV